MTKPSFKALRELQREFLLLRWSAICARGDQAFYARSIDTHVVTHALGAEGIPDFGLGERNGTPSDNLGARHSLPSVVEAASPFLPPLFLVLDAASCGLLSRRRRFANFGDGMISYDQAASRVEYYRENMKSYRARRLAVAMSLLYVWLFIALIIFFVVRTATGIFPRLTVPPYGSGAIHLILCLFVVLSYAIGNSCVPRHTTVGMREGSLPSLVHSMMELAGVTVNCYFLADLCVRSRYVSLVRSLSVILVDCWLDVRELTPGDRVTQAIAHAAATVRCLVIFFSYEYLRSVNCSLEFLTAMRYRGTPQRTIILLEALETNTEPSRTPRTSPGQQALTRAEATVVRDVLLRAVPGLLVATSVPELLHMLDSHCIRAVDAAGISSTIEWWAANGEARINRAPKTVHVVPPLLRHSLKHYWAFVCSCRRRRRGDIAGGFALIRGDGSKLHWYRPPDTASLTMLFVLFVEMCVFAHMFLYCSTYIDARVNGNPGFEGSCLTTSTFLYLTALLPVVMVVLQYFVSMRPDTSHVHDEVLMPFNVAAHSGGLHIAAMDKRLVARSIHGSDTHLGRTARGTIASLSATWSFVVDTLQTARSVRHASFMTRPLSTRTPANRPPPPPSIKPATPAAPPRSSDEDEMQSEPSRSSANYSSSAGTGHNGAASSTPGSAAEGFSIVFVTSDAPIAQFVVLSANMCEFITRRATGVRTEVIPISSLPRSARRFAMYVFLLDGPPSVDAFYRRVHCAPLLKRKTPARRSSIVPTRPQTLNRPPSSLHMRPPSFYRSPGSLPRVPSLHKAPSWRLNSPGSPMSGAAAASTQEPPGLPAWPTCQVVVLCHAEVLRTRAAPRARGAASSPEQSQQTAMAALSSIAQLIASATARFTTQGGSATSRSDTPRADINGSADAIAPQENSVDNANDVVEDVVIDVGANQVPIASPLGIAAPLDQNLVPSLCTVVLPPTSSRYPISTPFAAPDQASVSGSIDGPVPGSVRSQTSIADSDTASAFLGPIKALPVAATPVPPLQQVPKPPTRTSPSALSSPQALRPASAANPNAQSFSQPQRPPSGSSPNAVSYPQRKFKPTTALIFALDAFSSAQSKRKRWFRAIKKAAESYPKLFDAEPAAAWRRAPPVPRDLPPVGADGFLAPHLRAALFEYLLIVTGSKAGVDPSSPYESLSQALLDTVGRKVGAVLEAGSSEAYDVMPASER